MRDAAWQSELRARQARWRIRRELPIGHHNGRALASRLAMPAAETNLWNFLTPAIGALVRDEFVENLNRPRHQQKVYRYPRLFEDLLSSQPMAFNLFGELAVDLELATSAARVLWPARVERVTRVEFEWSPGRWDARYLNNGSAADVALFHTTPSGGRGAIFVETKYHENLDGDDYALKPRYLEVAAASRAFKSGVEHVAGRGVLQQFWFDHLLALATKETDRLDAALFVVMYPAINERCVEACAQYRRALSVAGTVTFEHRTLEDVLAAVASVSAAGWVADFAERYLTPTQATGGP